LLILGIDTATRIGSVGLVRAALDPGVRVGKEPGRITDGCAFLAEVSREAGLAHATELLSVVDECLAMAGASLEEVGCVAVSTGPGSFTGLRVGLATGKGLALAAGVPIVGVATLEALAATQIAPWLPPGAAAAAMAGDALIVPCLDARKGEVYTARFVARQPVWQDANPRLERLSADAASLPEGLGDELREALAAGRRVLLLGDGPERYRAQILDPLGASASALAPTLCHPSGAVVARLGAGLLALNGPHELATLVPYYARAAEAEIVRARRNGEP
jgi:tRNA threonylcarbamoyladenosine biosynthesis protein TsaB